MIQSPGSGDQGDMQKQALQNLSRLVRDKDLEIEALKQKNETLLAVLQDSSSNGTEISTLMQDKENLVKQLKVFQDERDQMILKSLFLHVPLITRSRALYHIFL
jgi:SMC interacting uncharacterized protein involved in chromosome segregation